MRKDSRISLLHIRDALERIAEYTTKGKKRFLAQSLLQEAVIYNLVIVGEAVKKLPKPLRDAYPAIPWKNIAGLRDIMVHEYDGTDMVQIWSIVERDLPTLRRGVRTMLRELGAEEIEREMAGS